MTGELFKKIDRFFNQLGVIFLYLLIIYLPFCELILHTLESKTALSLPVVFWITHFYEPILLILLLYFLIKIIFTGGYKKLTKVDWFISIFILMSIALVILRYGQLSRGLEGLRFLILPFAAYLLGRFSNYKNPKSLITIYLIITIFMSAIGIFEYFFLPPAYWAGYLGIDSFGYGQNSLITTSQATALLAGPNQLASYLLLAFFYLLHRFFNSLKPIYRDRENIFLLVVILAIGLTYSRSALVGLAVAVAWMFIYFRKSVGKKITQTVLFLAMAITAAFVFAMYNGELLRDLITHGSSFTEHLTASKDSFAKLLDFGPLALFFGSGVGSAGPTALKIGGIISENYYLQVIFETGVVGLGVLAAFLAGVLAILYRSSKTLFFALIALLVNALFLHIFSDNPAMAVTIFVLIAAVVNVEGSKAPTAEVIASN